MQRAARIETATDFAGKPGSRREPSGRPWSPRFVDYLFLAFTTGTEFGPTDDSSVPHGNLARRHGKLAHAREPAAGLLPDAPSGQYQIEVGWYLLGTLRRLNVLDAAGRATDDKVIIGEFVVP